MNIIKKILIIGSNGFIGKNTLTILNQTKKYEIFTIDKKNSENDLKNAILNVDFILNLAGVNRPKKIEEFYEGNSGLTEKIVNYLKENNKNTPILITSSIQAVLENDYGKSKKKSEEILIKYSNECGAKVYILRLPNIFGRWCKPNYNSVVATFCYNIANNKELWIKDPKIELSLIYIDDVVDAMLHCIDNNYNIKTTNLYDDLFSRSMCRTCIQIDNYYYEIPTAYKKTLGNIADTLIMFNDMRKSLSVPNLSDNFNKALYSTYLTYLNEDNFSYSLDKKEDDRGWLTEILKSPQFGQIFISKTHPNIIRGNHWHTTKTEKFIVIQGKALISFRKIDESKITEYTVDGENPKVLDIPPGYTHSIQNIGEDELITLFWSNEIFNPEKTDTYFLEVNKL